MWQGGQFVRHLDGNLKKEHKMKKIITASILILLVLPAGVAGPKAQVSDEAAIAMTQLPIYPPVFERSKDPGRESLLRKQREYGSIIAVGR